ncbi:MAG: MazG family protein, partial [Oscillospiraceae bacterium]|nr:MazG family protein [Oscillospiraceae bacterium]
YEDLVCIMRILRSEDGCPWDREQTHASIRNNFIEEVYEAIEAIDDENPKMLREELGDVLLQVLFHAELSAEAKEFDMDEVCDEICKKLIMRHPHIFADTTAKTSEQVLKNWENIKIEEKGYADPKEYVRSAAKSLPALMRAEKIQKRLIKRNLAKKPKPEEILKNLKEDFSNLEKLENLEKNENFEMIGQILYDIVALACEHNVNAEQALCDFNKKILKNL